MGGLLLQLQYFKKVKLIFGHPVLVLDMTTSFEESRIFFLFYGKQVVKQVPYSF